MVDHDLLRRLIFDERDRIRPEVQDRLVKEFRCTTGRGHRHLQAVVLRVEGHNWIAYRPIHKARDVWAEDWVHELPPGPLQVTCHCDTPAEIDLDPYRVHYGGCKHA
jgi:hypothetical protein